MKKYTVTAELDEYWVKVIIYPEAKLIVASLAIFYVGDDAPMAKDVTFGAYDRKGDGIRVGRIFKREKLIVCNSVAPTAQDLYSVNAISVDDLSEVKVQIKIKPIKMTLHERDPTQDVPPNIWIPGR